MVNTMDTTMEYRGYTAVISYDTEEQLFVGRVAGIKDSLNFHGTSEEEVTEVFHQSIDNYLDLCEKFGKPDNLNNIDELIMDAIESEIDW